MSINTVNLEAKDWIDKSEWKYLMEMGQFISREKVDPRNPRLQGHILVPPLLHL